MSTDQSLPKLKDWGQRYRSPSFWVAVFFGSGLIKPAPGTWGSLAALPFAYLMIEGNFDLWAFGAITFGTYLLGVLTIGWVQQAAGVDDASEIVIDEVVGLWIALIPLLGAPPSLLHLGLGFILFRFFDILKPWPIRLVDTRLKGPHGVMIDDVIAGCFAALWLYVLKGFVA